MRKVTHAAGTGVMDPGRGINGAASAEAGRMDRRVANAGLSTNHAALRIVVPGHREIGVMTGAEERVAATARIATVSMAAAVGRIAAAMATGHHLSRLRLP